MYFYDNRLKFKMTSVLHVAHYDVEKQAMIEPFTYLEMETSTTNPRDDLSIWVDAVGPTLMLGNVAVSAGGGGDVTGPINSTDNAIARFDGTGGKLIQNSLCQVTDSGALNFISPTNFAPSTLMTRDSTGVILYVDESTFSLGLGRSTGSDSLLLGKTGSTLGFSAPGTIILGHRSGISAGASDYLIIGNDVDSANLNCIFIGHKINFPRTSGNGPQPDNILIGHQIQTGSTATENVVVGNSIQSRGSRNVLLGHNIRVALNTSTDNVIIGDRILESSSSVAVSNVLIGSTVLSSATSASNGNILIGNNVGSSITTGVNNCLWIGATGVNGETQTIRIGDSGKTSCRITGIHGATSASNTQKNVKINSDGRLVGTYETRPYGCYTLSFSNPGAITTVYTVSYTANAAFSLPMGGTPSSYFSSDGLFVPGATTGSVKYIGSDTVLVKYTWSTGISVSMPNFISSYYLTKNDVVVPNTLVHSGYVNATGAAPEFITSVSTNDELQIGYTTLTGSGSINVRNETRFVEIIG